METYLEILDKIKKGDKLDANNYSKEEMFDALEMLQEKKFIKNVAFARGKGNKVLIAFYDDVKITLDGIEYLKCYKSKDLKSKFNENIVNSNQEIDIFLSYAWKDGAECNKIDHFLREKGINCKRDIRDIGYWCSIREFMNKIRKSDIAIMLISDNYLKSSNCMYEVLQLMKEEKYSSRIIPIIIESGIYEVENKLSYIRYWEEKYNNLKDGINGIDRIENTIEITKELKRYSEITGAISEFVDLICDLNNPDITRMNDLLYDKLKSLKIDKQDDKSSTYSICEQIQELDIYDYVISVQHINNFEQDLSLVRNRVNNCFLLFNKMSQLAYKQLGLDGEQFTQTDYDLYREKWEDIDLGLIIEVCNSTGLDCNTILKDKKPVYSAEFEEYYYSASVDEIITLINGIESDIEFCFAINKLINGLPKGTEMENYICTPIRKIIPEAYTCM